MQHTLASCLPSIQELLSAVARSVMEAAIALERRTLRRIRIGCRARFGWKSDRPGDKFDVQEPPPLKNRILTPPVGRSWSSFFLVKAYENHLTPVDASLLTFFHLIGP